MAANAEKLILVGDNPFHGISHLSQERARGRTGLERSASDDAKIVATALANGADGFSFSVSEVTLSILKNLRKRSDIEPVKLYAIVPYAFEYVRIATQTGTPGLAKKFAKQIVFSGNVGALFEGIGAVVTFSPAALMRTYLAYEISRIKSAVGKKGVLSSVLLHEVITDLALALDLEWLFKAYVTYLNKKGIIPGFNTRNFPFLVKKFEEWHIRLDQTVVETQFNKMGFQMNPSREEYEHALLRSDRPNALAISIMAAGYLKPVEAMEYVAGLENLIGMVVGVSTEKQAIDTFQLLRARFPKRI
jgi:hypothetical protein